MKAWFSTKELVGVAGLPGTDRGIQIMAKREDWKKQKRKGCGGGWEYYISSLPLKVQVTFGKANDTTEDPSTDSIGERLRSERKRLGLTQVSMAKIAGCCSRVWQDYELGKKIPGGKILANLHQQGIDITWIITGDKYPAKYISDCGMSPLEKEFFKLAIKTSYECRDIIDGEMSSTTQVLLIGDLIHLMMGHQS